MPVSKPVRSTSSAANVVTILLLILLPLIGIIVMWFWPKWNIIVKIAITVVVLVYMFLITAFLSGVFLAIRNPQRVILEAKCEQQCQGNSDISACKSNCLQNATNLDFDTYETSEFSLFYPKGYIKADPRGSEVIVFENSNTVAASPESISLRTENTSLPEATYQLCQKYGESFQVAKDDEIEARVAITGKGTGCEVKQISQVPGVNDRVVNEEKALWYPSSNTIYKVRAIYFENASRDQAKRLDTAVDQFTLK